VLGARSLDEAAERDPATVEGEENGVTRGARNDVAAEREGEEAKEDAEDGALRLHDGYTTVTLRLSDGYMTVK
jgi:hypothetical protein